MDLDKEEGEEYGCCTGEVWVLVLVRSVLVVVVVGDDVDVDEQCVLAEKEL
jgi:hypothetical protein